MPNDNKTKYYEEIFKHNGASYHAAMELNPSARDAEFTTALSFLDLKPDDTLLDIPAGGGYLERYLPNGIHYLGFDFSGGFSNDVGKCTETNIPIADNSVDHIVCLAALHHIENRTGFYQQAKRLLKPNGTLLIGDIVSNSPQDPFLNGFVDQWNELGHKGDFIQTEREVSELNTVGFECNFNQQNYDWVFESEQQAINYFRLLFTMNKNPSDQLIAEQINLLGTKKTSSQFTVSWHLGFIKAAIS